MPLGEPLPDSRRRVVTTMDVIDSLQQWDGILQAWQCAASPL
jgi:hypothetical protein